MVVATVWTATVGMSLTNPAPGGVEGRTDEGVDWSNIRGSIGAVAKGRIIAIYYGLRGFGTTIIERASNQDVYYALETGGGRPDVSVGQTVRQGQALAPGLGAGGIEVGYWNLATGRAVGAPGYTEGAVTAAGTRFRQAISGKARPTRSGPNLNVPSYVPTKYVLDVRKAAQSTGMPASVVAAQIQDESGFDPNAVSPTGAQGIAQFEPGTWKTWGKGSPFDPNAAFPAYSRFMSALLKQYHGNIRDALAAYNAGSGNLAAGYGYADNILSKAGLRQSATAGSASNYGATRPGGQAADASGQPVDTGQTVDDLFTAYETELTTPRTAPSPTGSDGSGFSWSTPFQWFFNSWTNNWDAETSAGQGAASGVASAAGQGS